MEKKLIRKGQDDKADRQGEASYVAYKRNIRAAGPEKYRSESDAHNRMKIPKA